MDNGRESYRRFCENGDESGLVEIIRDYKDGLIFYLNSYVGNIFTAEELAEDTFVLLGTKKPKDKGKGSFRTWLYTIGRNKAIDYLRKESKNKITGIDSLPEIISEEESFEETVIKEEQKISLHRYMRELKPEYRQILWLVYFEDMTCRDAAEIMKKSVHGTQTLLYRARKTLKSILEKEDFDYEGL